MLTTLPAVQLIPGVGSQNPTWLGQLLQAADSSIKTFCNQLLEYGTLTEYYSGDGQPRLVLNQFPVWPTGISVYLNFGSFWGQGPNSSGSAVLLTQGVNYAVEIDKGGLRSNRGTLVWIGGYGQGFWGFQQDTWGAGKLSASRLPYWPWGYGNISVSYSFGYNPIPADLQQACLTLVSYLVRNVPSGSPLSSESLGAYSYSVLQRNANGGIPELGSIVDTLNKYRDQSI